MDEIFLSLSSRLKESRKALGLNQAEAATLTGVTREHWGRCERGAAVPGGEVLAALAKAGADVRYILTGEREGPPPLVLSGEERLLLDYYRDAPPAVRKAAMAALLSGGTGSASQVFHGTVTGGVAGRDIVKGGGKR